MRSIIAIDIGSSLTKVLEAKPARGSVRVTALRFFRTPRDEQGIDEDAFGEQINSILSAKTIKSSKVGLSLSASTGNYAVFSLPPMPQADLLRAALNESKRIIQPQPTAEDIIASTPLKSPLGGPGAEITVFAGASNRLGLQKYVSLFKNLNITLDFVGMTPSNLAHFSYDYLKDMPHVWAMVDIGHKNTSVVIYANGNVAMVRTIAFAADDFIQTIVTKQKVDQDAALDTFLRGEEPDTLLNSWNYLVGEVRRSLIYYKEISGGNVVGAICFSGGMFAARGAFDHLCKSLGGEISLFEMKSIKNVTLDASLSEASLTHGFLFAGTLATAFFLAGRQPPLLNFLPGEARKEKITLQAKEITLKVSFFAVVGLAVCALVLLIQFQIMRFGFARLKKQFSQQEYEAALRAEGEIDSLSGQISVQNRIIERIVAYSGSRRTVLATIAKYIPSNVSIEEATVESSSSGGGGGGVGSAPEEELWQYVEFKFKGKVYATLEDAQRQLELFMKKLDRSGKFSYIEFKWPNIEEEALRVAGDQFTYPQNREFEFIVRLKTE